MIWERQLLPTVSGPVAGQVRLLLRQRAVGNTLRRHYSKPQYDEGELFAERLNTREYASKKQGRGGSSGGGFQWPAGDASGAAERDVQGRIEKMARLSAMFQGLLFVAGLGLAGTVYSKWPHIQAWWVRGDYRVDDDTIEQMKKAKHKKPLASVPLVPATEPGPRVPGLYYCGRDSAGGTLFPRRVASFDRRLLRDVCLASDSGDGGHSNPRHLAVDEHGDLLEWDPAGYVKVILPDQDLVRVKRSNGCAYALNRAGQLLVVPLEDTALRESCLEKKRSWLFPWKVRHKYTWTLDTQKAFDGKADRRVRAFDTGAEHLVLVTDKGNAYSCSTGTTCSAAARSRGQFGVPHLSQFDAFPQPNKLHEVELLNSALVASGRAYKRRIEQVACGKYHTLARDAAGQIYAFGSNVHGQLGLSIAYDQMEVPFPKRVGGFQPYFTRDKAVRCTDIHCADETSYAVMQSSDPQSSAPPETRHFAFGSGKFGQLGNGVYKDSQSQPTPIKFAEGVTAGDVQCGANHAACQLENRDLVTWGLGSEGQLASGKRFKRCKPQGVPELLEPGVLYTEPALAKTRLRLAPEQRVVLGGNATCIYWQKS